MSKEEALFEWLRNFWSDILSYRLNHLPVGWNKLSDKKKGMHISLDDLTIEQESDISPTKSSIANNNPSFSPI